VSEQPLLAQWTADAWQRLIPHMTESYAIHNHQHQLLRSLSKDSFSAKRQYHDSSSVTISADVVRVTSNLLSG
jgi:hypothetical protein